MKFTHLVIAGTAFVSMGAIAAGDTQYQRGAAAPHAQQHQMQHAVDADVIRRAQERLNQAGFDAGPTDGIKGPQTRAGVKNFQQAQGLPVTGELDQQTLSALGLDWAAGVGVTGAGPAGGTIGMAGPGNPGPAGGPMTVPDTGEARAPGMDPAPTQQIDSVGVTPGAPATGVGTFDREALPTRAPDVGEARVPGMAEPRAGDARSPATIREAQQQLNAAGYRAGPVDGIKGPRTRDALKRFQQAKGLPVSGELDQQTMSALGVGTGVGATPGTPGVGVTTPTTAPDVGEARVPGLDPAPTQRVAPR